MDSPPSIHPTAVVEPDARIGSGTRIWHFCHVMAGARIGSGCSFGQNCYIAGGVTVGDRVKVQNNVSLYDGVVIGDEVFIGPSAVFTNVTRPRAAVSRRDRYEQTRVERGATIGANATILPGVVLGAYCFVAAGAVVRNDVEPHALVAGVPARRVGWVSRHGERLEFDAAGSARCPATGEEYARAANGVRLLQGEGREHGS